MLLTSTISTTKYKGWMSFLLENLYKISSIKKFKASYLYNLSKDILPLCFNIIHNVTTQPTCMLKIVKITI